MLLEDPDELVAKALRDYAALLLRTDCTTNAEAARSLDRALRSCKAISGIDRVWVQWSYVGTPLGWLTDKEIVYRKGRCGYPKKKDEKTE